jgi:hypothetical protein
MPFLKKATVPATWSNATSGPITLGGAPPGGESVTTSAGPAAPEGPVGPVGPCGPLGPVGPVGPGSPLAPSVHAERTTTARRAVRRARMLATVAQWAMLRPTWILYSPGRTARQRASSHRPPTPATTRRALRPGCRRRQRDSGCAGTPTSAGSC